MAARHGVHLVIAQLAPFLLGKDKQLFRGIACLCFRFKFVRQVFEVHVLSFGAIDADLRIVVIKYAKRTTGVSGNHILDYRDFGGGTLVPQKGQIVSESGARSRF